MLRKFLLVLGAAALAGCATKPVVKDTTPLRPTAVIEKHVTSNGIRGFVPFETNELDYVRTNMRRNNSTFKGTGTFTRFLLGSHSGTKIYRVDRKLLWKLNTDDKEYSECPLTGCAADRAAAAKAKQAARQQQPQASHEKGCTMHLARSRVSVVATGKHENINGFDAQEYKMTWIITLRDKKRRTSTSKLDMDIWTTPLTADMRNAVDMDARYRRAFAAATGEGRGGQSELMPRQAAKLIMSYLGNSMRARDLRRFFSGGRKVRRIKGHPIRTTLTWNISGNACAPKEKPKQAETRSHTPTSVSGLVDMFAEHETKKAVEESASEPLLSFTVEIRQLKVTPLHDSVFDVPTDYKRVQPK